MKTLFRSQTSAFIASAVDFLLTIFLVEIPSMAPRLANLSGNVTGGVINFIMNRQWTFMATDRKVGVQALKYGLVWIGYIWLSYWAIVMGTEWLEIHYLVVKVSSAVMLGIGYNYLLHKHFVYS